MANEIKVFEFHRDEVRVVMLNDEPWFVAKDVCGILEVRNSRQALTRLEDDEKDDVILSDAIGREQEYSIVSESGLYSLVLSSRKPEARAFKRWVTGHVLPQIRKTGMYAPENLSRKQILELALAAEKELEIANNKIAELEPAAVGYHQLCMARNSVPFIEAAKILDTGRTRLLSWLRDNKILMSGVNQWGQYTNIPYQRYINEGYFEVKASSWRNRNGNVYERTKVSITPKGIAFLHRRMNEASPSRSIPQPSHCSNMKLADNIRQPLKRLRMG